MTDVLRILQALTVSEGLKRELRHSWLSDGRRESVAEHCFNLVWLAILVHPHLREAVDLQHSLLMIVAHDLPEAEAGDIPFFETGERRNDKSRKESAAMDSIHAKLPAASADRVREAWLEFEEGRTAEAKFVKALDHLEVQIQHNRADLATWEPVEYDLVYTKMDASCAHEPFLAELCRAVQAEAEAKLIAGGIDVESIKRRLGRSISSYTATGRIPPE